MRSRDEWDRGPWDDEPDELRWIDDNTRLPCVVTRGPVGSWCGYVGIPSTHPLFLKHYSDKIEPPKTITDRKVGMDDIGPINFLMQVMDGDEADAGTFHLTSCLDVHGGVTWANNRSGADEQATPYWWFGFDCMHAGDRAPGIRRDTMRPIWEALKAEMPPQAHRFINEAMADGTYRTMAYAKQQCERLADQLAHWPGYAPVETAQQDEQQR